MVKALFALAKYLTCWFIKPLVSRCYAHAANIKFQPKECSSCFKQYFPFLPGGENIHNYFIISIASAHYFIKPVLVALKILRDILSFTRLFMINTCPPVGCLENSDRKVKQFRVILQIASSCLVYGSSLQGLSEDVWFCNVTPDLYCKTVTQQTLR